MSKQYSQMRKIRDYAKFHHMNEAVAFIDHEFPIKKKVAQDGKIVELPSQDNPPEPPRAA